MFFDSLSLFGDILRTKADVACSSYDVIYGHHRFMFQDLSIFLNYSVHSSSTLELNIVKYHLIIKY